MGHEMAHVYMQHSAKQAGKAQTTSMLAGIASAVLGGTVGDWAGGLVGQLGQMGIEMGAQPDAKGQVQPERDWLVTVPQSDGSMIVMIFVAPQADFEQLKPTYEAMLKSIQFR